METLKEPVKESVYRSYIPDEGDSADIREVLSTHETGKGVLGKGYNYFQGNNLFDTIDDWTKRWNGYIPPMNPLLDQTQSTIFVNFTRNAIISYLSRVAMSPVKAHIVSVNKKSGLSSQKFANVLEDLNTFSLNNENGNKKFIQAALECATKGTVVVYEGYLKEEQKTEIPTSWNAVTGKVEYKKDTRVIFDDCFQEVVPLEDFFITNAFQSDVQKQPKIIWRKITSYSEAKEEFEHYTNFDCVKPGGYVVAPAMDTFYRDNATLQKDQVEILRYYCRGKNKHIILLNGVVMYSGPIPFKDGKYPFAKAVNEPFANDFFWGSGHPNKYMGEQDLINTFINVMADKNINSLLPTGLSSDLDDLIEDDTLEIGKFRKVGDIDKWKFLESPQVNGGEISMFQQVLGLANESAAMNVGNAYSPKGGKLQSRQILLKQQEQMQKLSFNMQFLEDLERDRTQLRISHILQFYSIPKMQKITGKSGKEIEKMTFRDIQLSDVKLSDGRKGTKIIKLIGDEHKNPSKRAALQDELSVKEMMGEENGTPTQAIAVSIDTFQDFNNDVQVVKRSSYEKNQALDQATKMEFAQFRLGLQELLPIANPKGFIEWLEESWDIDSEQFETAPAGQAQGQPVQPQGQPPQTKPSGGGILGAMSPSSAAGQAAA
jgi:hypothetical protein